MRRLMLIAATVAFPSLVGAQEDLTLIEQASRCWNLPPQALDEEAVVKFDVDLDARGYVLGISVARYEPKTETGKTIVLSASQAIEQCAPYSVTGAGVHEFSFNTSEFFGAESSIDPFKPLE